MSYETPESACPTCGHTIDAASHLDDDALKPKAGDISICFYCQALNKFDEQLQLVPPTEADLLALDLVEVSRVQRLLKNFNSAQTPAEKE